MTDYFVDVVDMNDNPTGEKVLRSISHEKAIPHRVAAVYVLNEEGKLYVQVHKKSGGLLDHTVGGHVDEKESYYEAAKREMLEEIDLDVPLQPVAEHILENAAAVSRGNIIHFHAIYKALASADWQFIPNEEVEELQLWNIEDVIESMKQHPEKFTYGFINSMKAYRNQND